MSTAATLALRRVNPWWVCMAMYADMQGLPATGGMFIPACGSDPVQPGRIVSAQSITAVYVFEVDQHAHEFMEAFREAHPDAPVLWDHMKVVGITPGQAVNSLLRNGLVPVQVRREWAPEMFRLYRDGHAKLQSERHGPAFKFAVDHSLEDYARIEREWRR